MSAQGYEAVGYAVERWLPEDKGPGVAIAFVGEAGPDVQIHMLVSDPLAWQIASRILALLDMPPITPDDEGFEQI